MELNEQQFWRALRQTLERAEADDAAELAEAELMLTEAAPAAEDAAAFSEQRLAEVVRLVTDAPGAAANAAAEPAPFDRGGAQLARALDEEQFWHALRHTLRCAEADEATELTDAERLLAQTVPEADAHLSEERIAEVVRLVTSADADAAKRAAARAAREERPRPAPLRAEPAAVAAAPTPVVAIAAARATWKQRIATLPRPLAAAAMLLLTPQFLAAAGVATAVFVTSRMMSSKTTSSNMTSYTVSRLSFEDAIAGMLREHASTSARESSEHVVFSHVVESIDLVQGLSTEANRVGSIAKQVLADLAQTLSHRASFKPRSFPDAHLVLGDEVLNRALGDEARIHALHRLAEQLDYGIRALQAIDSPSSPPDLQRRTALLLTELKWHLPK